MLDPTLRATLEQRLSELPYANTLEASPTQTIKPELSASRSEPGLPVISLSGETADGPRATTDGQSPDLELRSLLGEGGMGKVQLAFQRSLEREVAVKTTRSGASVNAASALVREARIAGTLEHPGVVPVHALGLDGSGAPVLVMKRIEGVEWGALIADPEHPGWSARPGDRLVAHLEILMQVCRTLHFAHKRGVLHLDVKPENVMVGDFGEVYLVDWGIARRFDPSSTEPLPQPTLAGTPAYMAPEMVTGSGVDVRTDVFLLGATLHTALTGEVKNLGANVTAVLTAAMLATPYAYGSEVPSELAEICNRATAREPADRFPSAEALRVALAQHLQHRSSIALAIEAAERSAALAALLGAAEAEKPPPEIQRAYRLASEARFGFDQALREWPENRIARERRTDCLALVADLEIRQGHVDAAEAALAEMDSVPESLRAKIERVRESRAHETKEHARLRALAHDLDSSVGAKQRGLAIGAFAAATVVGAAYVISHRSDLKTAHLLFVSLLILSGSSAMVFLMRRQLFSNAFNRQATTLFIVGGAGITLNRAVATFQHVSVSTTMTLDMLVLCVVMASGAATVRRSLWMMTGLLVASIAVSVIDPDLASIVFAVDLVALPLAFFHAFREKPD